MASPSSQKQSADQSERNAAAAPQAPSPPPHVLLLCDGRAWPRLGSIIRRMAVGLIDEAIKLSLLCKHDCPTNLTLPGLQGTHRLRRPTPLDVLRPARRFADLLTHMRHNNVTCLHALSLSCLKMALAARQTLNLPLVVTADADQTRPLSLLARHLGPRCIAVAMTEPIQNHLLSRAADSDRAEPFVRLIRPGIHPQERPKAPFEPGSPIAALIMERLTRSSELEAIIRTLAALTEQHSNIMLFFTGSGPAESALRKLASSLRVAEHVTFTGTISQLDAAALAADIVIMPSAHRRVHVYPLEAMAGATLLVAAAGHCYDSIIDGKTATEFQPSNARELTAKLRHLLVDPHKARSLAYAGREHIRLRHSVSRMASAFATIYQEIKNANDASQAERSRPTQSAKP